MLPGSPTGPSRPRSTPHSTHGFSLIELCITTTVAVLLVASAVPSLQGLLDRQRLQGAAARLATDVQQVRTDAVARNDALRLSFYSAAWGSCWVVHTGLREQCSCRETGAAQCTGGAKQLKTVALAAEDRVAVRANVASILFDPLHGTATPTGTLELVSPNAQAIRHVVNVMGRVRTCSPAASAPAVAGVRPC